MRYRTIPSSQLPPLSELLASQLERSPFSSETSAVAAVSLKTTQGSTYCENTEPLQSSIKKKTRKGKRRNNLFLGIQALLGPH
ncbi:unnamed protein product [Coffea canephora]|uniref:Uncharacterized protein n=1 Tax=Coffea canephora TaxID=49390 RepID=A0A068TM21_COFCA|nr:unnamed protein product [Coffea canephora]